MMPRIAFISLLCLGLLATLPGPAAAQDAEAQARAEMVELIRADAQRTSPATGQAGLDEAVLEVMGRVPRHRFVPPNVREAAYENRPLPIGHGQTISQPYIVAYMTDLLQVEADDKVLEIGTGSGYQAAVLAELVDQVYSMEIIEPLGEQAAARLDELGYDNVTTKIGDGYYGWEAHAPFDAIVVTAAADAIPPPLVRQLKPGARMVIPVGGAFFTQHLTLVEKTEAGETKTRQLLPVRFVPLTGEH